MDDLVIIARWYKSTHKSFRYKDAAKAEKDGQIFWTWVNSTTGEKGSDQEVFTLDDLQNNHPNDDLTKTAMGLLGPPDWVLDLDKQIKVKVVEPPCICTMIALWDGGCPTIRGQPCKSKR